MTRGAYVQIRVLPTTDIVSYFIDNMASCTDISYELDDILALVVKNLNHYGAINGVETFLGEFETDGVIDGVCKNPNDIPYTMRLLRVLYEGLRLLLARMGCLDSSLMTYIGSVGDDMLIRFELPKGVDPLCFGQSPWIPELASTMQGTSNGATINERDLW